MSYHIPFRSFNRSQRARINGATPTATQSAWANVDSPRVQRDLARHSAIGSLIQAGDGLAYTSDGYLQDGLTVSKVAGSLNLAVTGGRVVKTNGTTLTVAAVTGTPAVIATGVANPRIDLVCVDTSAAGAVVIIAGTATANANLNNRLGLQNDVGFPANRVPIAVVFVPGGSPTTLDTATVINLR